MIARDKEENGSHGLKLLMDIYMDRYNRPNRPTENYYYIPIFFTFITNNKLSAYVIDNNDLVKLCVTEAGYKLYANNKDGYSANGGGYNKPNHILDSLVYAMVDQSGKWSNELDRQDYFRQLRTHFIAECLDWD